MHEALDRICREKKEKIRKILIFYGLIIYTHFPQKKKKKFKWVYCFQHVRDSVTLSTIKVFTL